MAPQAKRVKSTLLNSKGTIIFIPVHITLILDSDLVFPKISDLWPFVPSFLACVLTTCYLTSLCTSMPRSMVPDSFYQLIILDL